MSGSKATWTRHSGAGRVGDIGLGQAIVARFGRVDLLIGQRARVGQPHGMDGVGDLAVHEGGAVGDGEVERAHIGGVAARVIDFAQRAVGQRVPDFGVRACGGAEALLVAGGPVRRAAGPAGGLSLVGLVTSGVAVAAPVAGAPVAVGGSGAAVGGRDRGRRRWATRTAGRWGSPPMETAAEQAAEEAHNRPAATPSGSGISPPGVRHGGGLLRAGPVGTGTAVLSWAFAATAGAPGRGGKLARTGAWRLR